MPLSRIRNLRRAWLGCLLWGLVTLAAGSCAVAAQQLMSAQRVNKKIRGLQSGFDDASVTSAAPEQLVLARVNELIRRERLDEAQALANAATAGLTPMARAKVLYNIANERTRRAIALVQKSDVDGATALVNLAKSEYRIALRINPDDWNAKYNLDVAMRMVRDLPVGAADEDEIPPDAPKRIWTDLPGVPKGLP